MKRSRLLICSLFLIMSLSAQQTSYPKGVYVSFEELKSKMPSQQLDLTVEARGNGEIKMNGGNDYKIESKSKEVKDSFIKKKIYAYSTGEALYLNGFNFGLQKWYAKTEVEGRYIIFLGAASKWSDELKDRNADMFAMCFGFGIIGGLVTAADFDILRFLYAIDSRTGSDMLISPTSIQRLMLDDLDLLAQFKAEKEKNIYTLLKYMNIINDKTKGAN